MSDVELVNADGVTVFRGSQVGGSQPLQWSTPVVIDNAGIIALPTSNVPEVLAAPGAGKVVVPVAALLVADFAVGYGSVDADGSDLGIYWDNGMSSVRWGSLIVNLTATTVQSDLTNFLSGTPARKLAQLLPFVRGFQHTTEVEAFISGGDLDVMEDTHMILYCTNGGAFTGGDAANTLTVSILYATHTL